MQLCRSGAVNYIKKAGGSRMPAFEDVGRPDD